MGALRIYDKRRSPSKGDATDVSGVLRSENAVAVMASAKRDGLKLFVALAFADDAGAPAVEVALALLPMRRWWAAAWPVHGFCRVCAVLVL